MARHTVRVFVLATLVLLLTGSVRLVQEAGAADGSASETSSSLAPAPGQVAPGIPEGSRELPALRRRNSRTYVTPDGTHVATISPRSVNYADEKGDWQPIENALVPSSEPGYSHESRGNRYKLALPSDLGVQPVRVSLGESWISFKLEGGRGSGAVSGKSARYANALSGVEVAYSAEADAVKEILQARERECAFQLHLDAANGAGANGVRERLRRNQLQAPKR